MPFDEIEKHFQKVLKEPPHIINIGGLETDHLRIECDREHPAYPNHGECNGGPFNVPFGILNPIKAFGRPLADELLCPTYQAPLRQEKIGPNAPQGMKIKQTSFEIYFESPKLSVAFSLIRPMLTHLAWDCLSEEKASHNRLKLTPDGKGGFGGASLWT